MYLKVQYNNSIKDYTLTDNYNKPYIKVNGSILPLTTNTTNGIHIKIQANNTTYRPLEYQSMSTSNTYYTSAINSNGLSSTTALTRSSTSETETYTVTTQAITLSISCTNTYSTRNSYGRTTLKNNTFIISCIAKQDKNLYTFNYNTSGFTISISVPNLIGSKYYTLTNSTSSTSSTTIRTFNTYGNLTYMTNTITLSNNYTSIIHGDTYSGVGTRTKTTLRYTNIHTVVFSVISSTSRIKYLTCSSTSGYSGVSSSSSQSSGWL